MTFVMIGRSRAAGEASNVRWPGDVALFGSKLVSP